MLVFPTCVGVFPVVKGAVFDFSGLPHVRGGVSDPTDSGGPTKWSSPRAWGCFSSRAGENSSRAVFPTCVGVFPWFYFQ